MNPIPQFDFSLSDQAFAEVQAAVSQVASAAHAMLEPVMEAMRQISAPFNAPPVEATYWSVMELTQIDVRPPPRLAQQFSLQKPPRCIGMKVYCGLESKRR